MHGFCPCEGEGLIHKPRSTCLLYRNLKSERIISPTVRASTDPRDIVQHSPHPPTSGDTRAQRSRAYVPLCTALSSPYAHRDKSDDGYRRRNRVVGKKYRGDGECDHQSADDHHRHTSVVQAFGHPCIVSRKVPTFKSDPDKCCRQVRICAVTGGCRRRVGSLEVV